MSRVEVRTGSLVEPVWVVRAAARSTLLPAGIVASSFALTALPACTTTPAPPSSGAGVARTRGGGEFDAGVGGRASGGSSGSDLDGGGAQGRVPASDADAARAGASSGARRDAGSVGTGGGPHVIEMGNVACADPPPMVVTEVVTDLRDPTFVAFEPGDATRFYVTERDGAVQRIDGESRTQLVSTRPNRGFGEQGLLSMAFHPNWGAGDEDRVYLALTASRSNNTELREYRLVGDSMTETERSPIADITENGPNHNGGLALFGPDGLLYLGLGDGGSGDDPNQYGQNTADPRGTILRMDVDNLDDAPMGNRSEPGDDPRIFHWGLRNPWRFSFDMGTGDMYIGDVGQDDIEEIDIAVAGSGGLNFGWSVREGSITCPGCPARGGVDPAFTDPIDEYDHDTGRSVTGGYVYRGSRIRGMAGRYVYADYEFDRVWAFTWDGAKVCNKVELSTSIDPGGELDGISSFGQDANGEVYLVTLDTRPGKVFRLDPAP